MSRPLRGSVRVQNRWFPKTRSWFALGAPVELLSPLSVVRVVYLLAGVLWPLAADGAGYPQARRWLLVVVAAVALSVWWALRKAAALGPRACAALIWLLALSSAAAVLGGDGSAGAVLYVSLWVPIGVLSALFVAGRALLVEGVGLAAVVGVGFPSAHGPIGRAALVVTAVVGYLGCTLALELCVDAARRRGTSDPDTGLPNGYGLAQRLAAGAGGPVIAAVMTLAGLAEAREALGYLAGSELLQRAVENLGQVVPGDALIGRVEGDEVVVVQPVGIVEAGTEAALVAARVKADELVAIVAEAMAAGSYLVDGVEITLRAHIGVALSPWDGRELTELVRKASLSARRAASGQLAVLAWGGDHEALIADDLALLADLRQAGSRGELWLAYQPQLSADGSRVVGVEALLRWSSPTRGGVPPARFIPLAERTGLVSRLTQWVLGEALDAQVRWRAQGVALPVGVNLSAVLLNRDDLPQWILGELHARRLPGSVLTLEVTETAETADLLRAKSLLRAIHDGGVRISLDDFGTGYTSLAALPGLPLDELKIDQSFVRRSATSAADDAIVRTATELGHRLGYTVVAEGVEDGGCSARVVSCGVDVVQGYHFAEPLEESALRAFITSRSTLSH